MTAAKHHVTIKGVKDGLVFLLDDACPFADLIHELRHKLEKTHQQLLSGPIIHVHIKLGNRIASEEEKEEIRGIIGLQGNLLIQTFESLEPKIESREEDAKITVMKGIVRAGQTIEHDGNLLYLGDVNPGGCIVATGDIHIMGTLRGMAHAGSAGNEKAIIAASHMRPTQLRIAGVISRPPDEWSVGDTYMEFAYVQDGKMEIDKIHHLHRVR